MCGYPLAVVKEKHKRSVFELLADVHFNEFETTERWCVALLTCESIFMACSYHFR